MGAFADFLGGLLAAKQGDPDRFVQGVTKEGRAELNQQRQNQMLQKQMMQQVLQQGMGNPEYNPMLQQARSPFLQNQAVETGTRGQQLQNEQAQNVNQFFQSRGGSPQAAQFGLNERVANSQIAGQDVQTAQGRYQFANQRSLDELAAAAGFPSFQAMQFQLNRDELSKTRQHEMDVAKLGGLSRMADNFFPLASGQPSPVQTGILGKMGLEVPPDPEAAARRAAYERAIGAINNVRGGQQQPQQPRIEDYTLRPPPGRGQQPSSISQQVSANAPAPQQQQIPMPEFWKQTMTPTTSLEDVMQLLQFLNSNQ